MQSEQWSEGSAIQHGSLVHIFVFDAGGVRTRDPRYVTRLVRSLAPESVVYEGVPISVFVDMDMPDAVGQWTALQLDALMSYHLAWKKIKETDPALVEGLEAGNMNYTFSWKGYEGEDGSRGVLFAFYELTQR
jgi:hypothetical protein